MIRCCCLFVGRAGACWFTFLGLGFLLAGIICGLLDACPLRTSLLVLAVVLLLHGFLCTLLKEHSTDV